MANIRVKDLPNTNAANDNDEFIVDSSTSGTRRISYSELKSEISTDFAADVATYGIATLDSDNKLTASQIPDSLAQGLNFVGVANSAGDLTSTTQGDFYVIQTAFGAYSVGDQAVYDGSAYVRVVDGTKEISEGGTGATTLDAAKTNLEIIDVGTGPSQVPLNQHLGTMAYQSSDGVSVATVSADEIGVGTSDPNYEIEVKASNARIAATSDGGVVNHLQSNSTTGFVGTHTNHPLALKTNGTTRATVTAAGLVGIGTSSPSSYDAAADDLVVGNSSSATNSGVTVATVGGGVGSLYFADGTSGSSRYAGYVVYNHGSNSLVFGANTGTRATIDSSGRLGVNQPSPGSMIHVKDNGDASNDGGIQIERSTNSDKAFFNMRGGRVGVGSMTSVPIKFYVNGNNKWSIGTNGHLIAAASGVGIDFGSVAGGTGTPSTNGGLLDDYETGTATVAFLANGGGSVTIKSTHNTIHYTKIGNVVHFNGELAVGSVSSPTGELHITGLPFAAQNVSNNRSAISLHTSVLNSSTRLAGFVENGQSYVVVRLTGTTGYGQTAATVVQANSGIVVGGSYRTA